MDRRINEGPHDTATSAGLEALARRSLVALMLAAPWASLVAQPWVQLRLIGVLSLNRAGSDVAQFEAATLRQALRAVGLEEGRHVQIHWRYADTDLARLASQADELVRLDVALILAVTNAALEAAMHATRRIPIVVIAAVLPVELGLVRSLAQPGGYVTGTASFVARILAGAAPAELPMELPTKYDLIINRKALKAIGVTLPNALLQRADEVIE